MTEVFAGVGTNLFDAVLDRVQNAVVCAYMDEEEGEECEVAIKL